MLKFFFYNFDKNFVEKFQKNRNQIFFHAFFQINKIIFKDVQTATEMGISVYTVPGSCTEEVADSTMCHILNLYRRLTFLNESVRQGRKQKNNRLI